MGIQAGEYMANGTTPIGVTKLKDIANFTPGYWYQSTTFTGNGLQTVDMPAVPAKKVWLVTWISANFPRGGAGQLNYEVLSPGTPTPVRLAMLSKTATMAENESYDKATWVYITPGNWLRFDVVVDYPVLDLETTVCYTEFDYD